MRGGGTRVTVPTNGDAAGVDRGTFGGVLGVPVVGMESSCCT